MAQSSACEIQVQRKICWNANHSQFHQKFPHRLTALDTLWRWDSSYEQRSVLNKVAQFNLCGRSCTAAIDSVMKPLSFKFCLLYIPKENQLRQPLWRHANTLIFLIRASPNWTLTLTSRTNALRAQTCAGQEERRRWPRQNLTFFILFSTPAVTFCLFAYC